MATPPKKNNGNEKKLTVVGSQQDGCGNLVIGSKRRTVMIRKQIRKGMPRRDVESMLGKPDKVTTHNGETRYHYSNAKGNKRQVTFDEAGCVKGKR